MKKALGAVVVFLMVGSHVLAAEAEKMPQAARDALAKMDQEIDKSKNAAIVVLKKSLQEETKKGNLKTANRIQEKIDALSPWPSVVGIWTGNGYGYELKENGEVVSSNNNKGKWTIDKSKLLITFPRVTDIYRMPPKNGVLKGTSSRGASILITKDE